MHLKQILLADDDEDDLEMIKEALLDEEPSLCFHTFQDGAAVLHFLERASPLQLPCLIVLDYNLPILNAVEILSAMQRLKKLLEIPKLIFSTSNAGHYREKCIRNGALDYFAKPVHWADYRSLARTMLRYCCSFGKV